MGENEEKLGLPVRGGSGQSKGRRQSLEDWFCQGEGPGFQNGHYVSPMVPNLAAH